MRKVRLLSVSFPGAGYGSVEDAEREFELEDLWTYCDRPREMREKCLSEEA